MKILALDTSTDYCSVALHTDGETDVRETRAGQTHSSLVLRMIDELLSARALSVNALDGIAFGEGPGSFTGLRIACGVVQGLAFGANLRVVGVGTLLAMAEGSAAERVVCCVDARVHEIYHAAYERRDGAWHAVHEPSVRAPAAAPELAGSGWLACGSGFKAYGEALASRYAGQLARIDLDLYPHARDIAALALPAFAAGRTMSAEEAAPVYCGTKWLCESMSAQIDSATTYSRMAEDALDQVVAIEHAVHVHPWTRGNFADSISAGYHCWVAQRGRSLVGYGVAMIAADEAHLLNLSVAPGWQRKGIGTELASFFVKLARDYGAEKIYLEVRPSNGAARALYAKHGFAEIGLRRDYYPAENGREDAVIMELHLK